MHTNVNVTEQFQLQNSQEMDENTLREYATQALIIVMNFFPDKCCISLPENLCMRISIMKSENQIYSLDLNNNLSYHIFREFDNMKTIVLEDFIKEQLHAQKLLLRLMNLIQDGEIVMNEGVKANSIDPVAVLRPTVIQILTGFTAKNKSHCKMKCDPNYNAKVNVHNDTCTYTIDLKENLEYIIQADTNTENNQQEPIEGKISTVDDIKTFLYKVTDCLPAQGSTPFIEYLFTAFSGIEPYP